MANTYIDAYVGKILISPEALAGEGYFSNSNWSTITYEDPACRWSRAQYMGQHTVTLAFDTHKWGTPRIQTYTLEDVPDLSARVVDTPESFACVEEYLAWMAHVGIRNDAHSLGWIAQCVPGVQHCVMRSRTCNLWPGGYGLVGVHQWPTRVSHNGGILEHAVNQQAVRYLTAKRCWQAWGTPDLSIDQQELLKTLQFFPDLTDLDLHELGLAEW